MPILQFNHAFGTCITRDIYYISDIFAHTICQVWRRCSLAAAGVGFNADGQNVEAAVERVKGADVVLCTLSGCGSATMTRLVGLLVCRLIT